MQDTWEVLKSECWLLRALFGVEIHAVVLMSNHLHMLLTVPYLDLGKVMQSFMSYLTRALNERAGRSGRVFGSRYHPTLIQGTRHYANALKYVYRNPIKAGLCTRVEDYPFSTLHGLVGASHLGFPIELTRVGMEIGLPLDNFDEYLSWLNRPFPKEAEELIQKALKKREFRVASDRATRKKNSILDELH